MSRKTFVRMPFRHPESIRNYRHDVRRSGVQPKLRRKSILGERSWRLASAEDDVLPGDLFWLKSDLLWTPRYDATFQGDSIIPNEAAYYEKLEIVTAARDFHSYSQRSLSQGQRGYLHAKFMLTQEYLASNSQHKPGIVVVTTVIFVGNLNILRHSSLNWTS